MLVKCISKLVQAREWSSTCNLDLNVGQGFFSTRQGWRPRKTAGWVKTAVIECGGKQKSPIAKISVLSRNSNWSFRKSEFGTYGSTGVTARIFTRRERNIIVHKNLKQKWLPACRKKSNYTQGKEWMLSNTTPQHDLLRNSTQRIHISPFS